MGRDGHVVACRLLLDIYIVINCHLDLIMQRSRCDLQ
jgi:hypothetical protein